MRNDKTRADDLRKALQEINVLTDVDEDGEAADVLTSIIFECRQIAMAALHDDEAAD